MQLAPEMPRIEMALPQTLIGRSRPSTAWLPERTLPAPEVWTPSEAMAGEPANRTPPATAMAPAARTFFSMCFSSGNRSQGPQLQTLTDPHARSIQKLGEQTMLAFQKTEDANHFIRGQHHRQAPRRPRSSDLLKPGQI